MKRNAAGFHGAAEGYMRMCMRGAFMRPYVLPARG